MTLRDYLDSRQLTADQFAAVIEVDPVSVNRYLRGVRKPKWAVMARIMSATDGAVTPNDFVSERAPRKRRVGQACVAA